MLKIPEEGKLVNASHLYRYADGEYQRAKVKFGDCEFTRFAENVRDIIGEMTYDLPAVDAVEVVRGRWEWYREENCVICSECKDVHYLGAYHQYSKNYCPNCGADMRYDCDT